MSFAVIAQRHHQELGALENALDLQRQKFLGPWSQGLCDKRALFVDQCVNPSAQRLVGGPNEAPRLRQIDTGRGMCGL